MNDPDALRLLEAMVRIPSVSGNEAEIADFLVETMNSAGFRAFTDGAGNAVGEIGDGPRTIVLLGHMDTVPGNVPVRIEDGKLYGRGSVDAKGPLAAFIAAAARVGGRPDCPFRIVVIGCVEEESPSSKGAWFVTPNYRPDYCIVGEPSGWDAVTLGYKGFLRIIVTLGQDVCHSAHPTATVGERACDLWTRIRDDAAAFNREHERFFDQLLPTLVSIRTDSDGRREQAELRINFRLPPSLPPDAAEARVRQIVGDEGPVEILGGVPAWFGSRTTPLHRASGRAIRIEGGTPRHLLKTGTADLNIVAPAWGCPALAYGPGDSALDHTPNEHIDLDEYLRAVSILEHTLNHLE